MNVQTLWVTRSIRMGAKVGLRFIYQLLKQNIAP